MPDRIAKTRQSGEESSLREKVARAMMSKDILPVEGSPGVRIVDFVEINPIDLPDLGIEPSRDENGRPTWHWHSDIRGDEQDEALAAILAPLADAAIAVCMEEAARVAEPHALQCECCRDTSLATAAAIRSLIPTSEAV